jgi:tocopherol O-methyltransferase
VTRPSAPSGELSDHARRVREYYDAATPGFYLEGWDPEHIHLGLFDARRVSRYQRDMQQVTADRAAAVRRMTRLIVDGARISDGDLVVDAGCGVGGTAMYIAERYACSVVGLNINRLQLTIARQRARERRLPQVTFRYADCSRKLPFPDDSVDAVVNIESACHYPDRARFIAECARVLRPGGRLVAQDWMASEGLSGEHRERHLAPLEAAWFLWQLESLSSYRSMLEAAGFEVRAAEPLGRGILPNGYFMRLGYGWLLFASIGRALTDLERANMERFRTFSNALLGGFLAIGRYVAVKP